MQRELRAALVSPKLRMIEISSEELFSCFGVNNHLPKLSHLFQGRKVYVIPFIPHQHSDSMFFSLREAPEFC